MACGWNGAEEGGKWGHSPEGCNVAVVRTRAAMIRGWHACLARSGASRRVWCVAQREPTPVPTIIGAIGTFGTIGTIDAIGTIGTIGTIGAHKSATSRAHLMPCRLVCGDAFGLVCLLSSHQQLSGSCHKPHRLSRNTSRLAAVAIRRGHSASHPLSYTWDPRRTMAPLLNEALWPDALPLAVE